MTQHEQRDTASESETNHDDVRAARIDLVVLDHLQRRHSGEDVSDAAIIAAHQELMPELAERLREIAEFSRQRNEANAAGDDHRSSGLDARALRIRCPHCRQSTEVLSDADFDHITCDGCGSQFSLARQTVESREAPSYKRIAQFELIERLGLGSFGTVWKARDTELDRTVAVKIPRRGQLDPSEIEKFLREARTAAQLSHKNVARVYEIGREGDTVYIVSELIRGVSLADWLTAKQPTFQQAAELCAKIAEALHYAHESGVVHRDLKPANIMLDDNDEPHLMDFGLAKREAGEVTMTLDGHVLGTPAYMSPEQARGEAHHANRRTDVYALGVVLFELLTGELPFRGSARMLIHQLITDEVPSPRKFNGSVPRDLETICLKCLEKESRNRYESAEVVSDELRRWILGKPIEARPITRIEKGWRWCQRNPLVATLGAVVGTLTLLFAIGGPLAAVSQSRLKDEAELHRYVSDISLAYSVLNEGDVNHAERILREHIPETPDKPDFRSFEWDYLCRLCQGDSIFTFPKQKHEIQSLAVSPDGTMFATTSIKGFERGKAAEPPSGELILYSTTSKQALDTLRMGLQPASCVMFSPDGKTLVSGNLDGSIDIWVGDNFQKRHRLERRHEGTVIAVAFSPTGKVFATGGEDQKLLLWKYSDKGVEFWWEILNLGFSIRTLAFSQDGHTMAAGGQGATKIIKLVDIHNHTERNIEWPKTSINSLAFSPTDTNLLAVGNQNAFVKLVNISTMEEYALGGHRATVLSVAFLPDGKLVSASMDHTIRLWDCRFMKQLEILKGHTGPVWCAIPSADGQGLYSVSGDKTVKFWGSSGSSECDELLGHTDWVRAADCTPEGKWLVTGAWDGTIRLWDLTSGTVVHSLDAFTPPVPGRAVMGLACHPEKGIVVVGCGSGRIQIWDTNLRKKIKEFEGHTKQIFRLVMSPDGKRFASATGEWYEETPGEVKLWNAETFEQERSFIAHAKGVSTVVFTPDGRKLVTGGFGGRASLWEVATGERIYDLPGLPAAMSSAISSDGRFLATGGGDSLVTLWDLNSAAKVTQLQGNSAMVECLAFTSDDRTLVAGYGNGTIKLWNVQTGREMITLKGHEGFLQQTFFSPNRDFLVSASADGTVRLWPSCRYPRRNHVHMRE